MHVGVDRRCRAGWRVPARVSVMGRWGRVLMLQVLVPSLFAEFEIPQVRY